MGAARRLWLGLRARPYAVTVVLAAVVLRIGALIAYRPALEFNGDSYGYLDVAAHLTIPTWHPVGYSLLLRALSWTGSLAVVPVVQHLMGVATGCVVYRFVRERGGSDRWAALAAAPVLLDAWSVAVEQGIVTEATFGLLVALSLLLLLRRTSGWRVAAVGGGLLAAATVVRTTGLVVGIAVLLYLLLCRRGWRVVVAAGATFLVPTLGYATAFAATNHVTGPDGYSGRYLYGETAMVADCSRLPAVDRKICPAVSRANRAGPTSYVWGSDSPMLRLVGAREPALNAAGQRFATAVLARQPLDFARYVVGVTARFFTPGRTATPTDYPAQTWQFPATVHPPPVWSITVADQGFDHSVAHPHVDRAVAGALRAYQHVGFTPGPALAVAALLALVGAWRSRRRPGAADLAFLPVLAIGLLTLTSATSGAPFDYRYLLVTLVMLPPAGVLGARAVWQSRRHDIAALRRIRPAVVTAVLAAAFVATNLLAGNVTPSAAQQATSIHPMGDTVQLADGLRVTLAAPTFWKTRCAKLTSSTPPVVQWFVEVQLTVRDYGAPRLAQAGNLYTAQRFWAVGRSTRRGGRWLTDALLTRSEPRRSGRVYLVTTTSPTTVSYTDPTGAGTASWRLDIVPSLPEPQPGSACTPPPPPLAH